MAVALALLLPVGLWADAAAATGSDESRLVHRVTVDGALTSLTLNFDRGISAASAERVRSSFKDKSGVQSAEDEWKLGCSDTVKFIDSRGTFDVAYYCGKRRTMPWGYKLSRKVRSIIVGNIREDGLRWWRNGASQSKNAGHVVPPDYHLHGTMRPVYRKNDVDCQDYITFRHNVGPGGRGSVTFAAHLQLTN